MRGLKDRVALVTGAGRGIGRAIAERLAAEGAKVAALDVDERTAREAGEAIGGIGLCMDVTDAGAVAAAIAEAERRLGPTDILVNNAGWDKAEPFVKSAEETWDKVLAINLKGPIRVTRAVLDGMIERRRGRIVSISSDAGRVGSSGEAVYSAAKAGIIGFTKSMARELASREVTVNAVAPGLIETEMTAYLPEDRRSEYLQLIPVGRLGTVDEVAELVGFLARREAGYITGQVIGINGGLYI